MSICQNCGKQLDDGVNFCDDCGTVQLKAAFCPKCGELLKDGAEVCAKCGAKVSSVVSADKKPGGKNKVILGAAAAVLLAAAAAAAVYFLVIAKKPDIPLSMYYIKNNNLMHTDFKGKEPVCVGENAYEEENETYSDDSGINEVNDYYFKTSKDGKKAAYAFSMEYRGNTDEEEGYPLHFTDNENPEIIVDSSVLEHYISDGGEIITYIKIGNNGCELWQYDTVTAEKTQLDTGVVSGYRETMLKMSPDKLTALYVNGRSQLCLKKYGESKRKVADNVPENYFFGLNDFTEFVYLKDNDLCKMTADGKKKIIAADVQSVENVYDTGEIYFTRKKTQSISLSEFLDDDMESTDVRISKPIVPDYPSRDDYSSRYAYEAAIDDYWDDYYDYLHDFDAYYEMEERDEIRIKARNNSLDIDNNILYYYTGSSEKKVAEYVQESSIMIFAKPAVAYYREAPDNYGKVKISDFSDYDDFYSSAKSLLYTNERELYLAVKADSIFLDDCSGLFYIESDSNNEGFYGYSDIDYEAMITLGNIYKVDASGGKPQKPALYEEDVFVNSFFYPLSDGRLVYGKQNGEKADLYMDKKKIDQSVTSYEIWRDVHSFQYIESTGAFFYLAEKNSGSVMKMYDNGTITEIADNVNDIRKLPDDTIAYLDNTGNLYRYSRGKSKLIDSDIYALVK